MTADKSLAQRLGPLFGAFYIAIGILGFFVTGFVDWTQQTPDKLFGFSINPFHNLVHLGIGAFLLLMSTRKSAATAEGAVMGVGLFYIVAFVIGVTAPDNLTILSMSGEGDLENLNHIVNGVALLTIGLLSSGQTQAQMKRRGLA
jgi:Domain of unknown function (DUF4383)